MTSLKNNKLLYLWGFCLVVLFVPEFATGDSIYPRHSRSRIAEFPEKNFTGFRSAFQWTLGNTLINNYGLHNTMQFTVNETFNPTKQIMGEIGIVSNGSRIAVHFSFDSVESMTAGPTFNCSRDFPYLPGFRSCFNLNYTLISNAIYFLDVEIRYSRIRGYISDPQRDLRDINDPYLPRYLIGDIKTPNEMTNLYPKAYTIGNYYGNNCDNLSEIMIFNYGPEVYHKLARKRADYGGFEVTLYNCELQNMMHFREREPRISTYISRPPAVINNSRSLNSLKNSSTLH